MIHPPDRDLNPLDRGFNTLCKRRLLQCPSDPIDRRGLRAGGKGKRGGGRGGGGERKEGSKGIDPNTLCLLLPPLCRPYTRGFQPTDNGINRP